MREPVDPVPGELEVVELRPRMLELDVTGLVPVLVLIEPVPVPLGDVVLLVELRPPRVVEEKPPVPVPVPVDIRIELVELRPPVVEELK